MLKDRIALYRQLEELRERPLIVYVTSARQNCGGSIASDAVSELLLQLDALPANTKRLDLLLVSHGGDPTVAWRIVSLIRERVSHFAVLVPQAAYSAATLIALGADEIVMHPHGNLGPTDPQIQLPRKGKKDEPSETVRFGSEDLTAFLRFAKEDVGLTDQRQLLSVFNHFCEEVGSVAVGVAARSAQLMMSMGEKLLRLHMDGDAAEQKAHAISEALTRDFFHHGYPVSRSEAKSIGLDIADTNKKVDDLAWKIWLDISQEMKLREPFNPLALVRKNAACAALFAPIPQLNIPGNIPGPAQQQLVQQILQNALTSVPATAYLNVHALMESTRIASRWEQGGHIFATRQPDLQVRVAITADHQGWRTIDSDEADGDNNPRKKVAKKKAKQKAKKKAVAPPGDNTGTK